MNTPLFLAVDGYVKKNMSRFHMPSHKGMLPYFEGAARYDVTEIPGCDELYRPTSAIAELEARYARLYESDASLLSAGGSTLCIQTMLALTAKPGDKVIIARGCHASAVNAMALLDLRPVWVFPEYDQITGLAKQAGPADILSALTENKDAACVYITSPDYCGAIGDVAAISGVCREFGVPLLVDNAHGAHLKFLSPALHPLSLGAAMCADSLHKTLPVLTGGAMLHIKNTRFTKDAKRYMSVFGSTSPGYLVMLSADAALVELEGGFSERLEITAKTVKELKAAAKAKGFAVLSGAHDPLKLALGFGAMGYTGGEFGDMIRACGIEPEMVDEAFCVLMTSPSNTERDFKRLFDFIVNIKPKAPLKPPEIMRAIPKQAMTPREAVFSSAEEINVENSSGKIAGSFVAPCPPGVPYIIPGEVIDENLTHILKMYGISRINVIK